MDALLNKIGLVITSALQLVVLYLLLSRSLHRRFRWFLAYIIYELCETVLRFSAAGNRSLYFKVYWLTAIGGAILSVLAVRESFLDVFWMYARLRWFTRVLWACVALALLYSLFKAWLFPPIEASPLVSLIIGLEVAVDYSIGIVGILYFVLILFFKVKEHQWDTGIIAGFTAIAVVSVVGALIRSVFGTKFDLLNRWLGPVAYWIAEIEWVFALSRPERQAPILTQNFTIKEVTTFDQYIKILGRLLGRKS
jgi:hypothetical protein